MVFGGVLGGSEQHEQHAQSFEARSKVAVWETGSQWGGGRGQPETAGLCVMLGIFFSVCWGPGSVRQGREQEMR